MTREHPLRKAVRVLAIVVVLGGAWWAYRVFEGTRWTDASGQFHIEPASLGQAIGPAILLVAGLFLARWGWRRGAAERTIDLTSWRESAPTYRLRDRGNPQQVD